MQKGMYTYIHTYMIQSHHTAATYGQKEWYILQRKSIQTVKNIPLIAMSRSESQSVILYLGKL
jgi:hypothetical protein